MLMRVKSILFILVNIMLSFFLPKIKEKHEEDFTIVPYNRKYFNVLNNVYIKELGNGKSIRMSIKTILMISGSKTAFIMLNNEEKLIGYCFYYFNFNDIKYKRIHGASAAMLHSYQKTVYGGLLYLYAWDWFKYNTWVMGISARYRVNNKPVKRYNELY